MRWFGMIQTKTAEEVEKYSKRTVRVTRQHNDECKRLLTLMGVPIIEARPPVPSCPQSLQRHQSSMAA